MKTFSDLVRVRHKDTGEIGYIARRLFENPRINNGILEQVDETAKPRKRLSASDIYDLTVKDPEVSSASEKKEVTDA